ILGNLVGKETEGDRLRRQASEIDIRVAVLEADIEAALADDTAEARKQYIELSAERAFQLSKAKAKRKAAVAADEKAAEAELEAKRAARRKLVAKIQKKSAERGAIAAEIELHFSRAAEANERLFLLSRDIVTLAGAMLDQEARAAALLDRASYRNAIG